MNEKQIKSDKMIQKIVSILVRHGAIRVSIFGSYARGEAAPGSDIDIIVEFSQRKSLLEIVGIEQELSETLGRTVDLLTEKAISPYLIERINRERVVIYG